MPEASDGTHERMLAARAGIALLVLPAIEPANSGERHELPDLEESHRKIWNALDADTRVSQILPASASTDFRQLHFASTDSGKSEARPGMPHQHVHVLTFSEPILFSVQIAKRLQFQGRGERAIPAETYYASWDGIQLLVAWDHGGKNPFGYVGGLSVIDVLHDAAKAAGFAFKSQSCGPHCGYPFSHQDLKITSAEEQDDVVLTEVDGWTTLVRTPPAANELALLHNLSLRFAYLVRTFARLRSHGTVIWKTERLARRDLGDLLRVEVERAHIRAMNIFRSLPTRWKNRGIQKKADELIARVWMRLATLEQNKRDWDEYRYLYESSQRTDGIGLIFRSEYPDEVNSVGGLEVTNLRDSAAQMTSRADNGRVAQATVWGALSGGLVGALITGVVTFVASQPTGS